MSNVVLALLFLIAPEDPLSVTLELKEQNGQPIVKWDQPLTVLLTNTSGKTVYYWSHFTRNGYHQLTFQFVNLRTGEKYLVQRRKVDHEALRLSTGHRRGSVEEPGPLWPGDVVKMKLELSHCFPNQFFAWTGSPCPNSDDAFQLTAHLEARPGPPVNGHAAWTGTIQSKPLTVKLVASKLKTPHDYLRYGFPAKAIEMMKADPKWITTVDDKSRNLPLHQAVASGSLEAVRWLLDHGADVHALDVMERTPLHLADDGKMADLLLKKNARVAGPVAEGHTPYQRVIFKMSQAASDAEKKKWHDIVNLYKQAGAKDDLLCSVYLNDLANLKTMLAANPQLADSFQEKSLLRIAATLGRLEICRYLLDHGKVDINDVGRGEGLPILVDALAYPDIVKLLLDHQADIKSRITWKGPKSFETVIDDDATVLHYAAQKGTPVSIKHLLDAGVDLFAVTTPPKFIPTWSMPNPLPGEKPKRPQTALHIAAGWSKVENLRTMLDHEQFKKASPAVRTGLLNQCLVSGIFSTWNSDEFQGYRLTELLLKHGASPEAELDGQSAMQAALLRIYSSEDELVTDMKKVVRLLWKSGARLPLYGAVALGDEAEVTRLLKLDPRCASDRRADGYPALCFAIDLNNRNILSALLKAGCDPNLRNQSTFQGLPTPVYMAAMRHDDLMLQLLIDAGGDVNPKNRGATPLHYAARFNCYPGVKLLLHHGANPQALDSEGKTPLDLCKNDSYVVSNAVQKLLQEYQQKIPK